MLLIMSIGSLTAEETNSIKNAQSPQESDPAIYLKYEDFKWEKLTQS